ncbi:nuclear receptor corepressor 1 [Trichonephila clavata]|uniref:Nuclear receptor corepressor 1 n=1 Tax=Trichonephila clavata TaxID=2740835 RepID=A0A8X6JD15_TRICU|nr:nuclear receptor corepressor 1 [Trichonephila clavata]
MVGTSLGLKQGNRKSMEIPPLRPLFFASPLPSSINQPRTPLSVWNYVNGMVFCSSFFGHLLFPWNFCKQCSFEHSHALKKSIHWPPHEGNAQYKRPPHQSIPHGPGGGHHSPPLTGTRGYPYPQDPSSRCPTSSTSYVTSASSPHLVHPGGGGAIYASANHMYRDNHFQVDARPPAEPHHIDRYGDHNVQHVRRRLSLRPAPTPEYTVALERERYMDAFRYQYEREVALGVSYSPNAITARTLKPPVVSVHTPSEMDNTQPMKRPRLAVEPKAPVHQPLTIDTRNVVIKKEPAYTPQVEAISPTLPSEEGRCESPMRLMKENILQGINKIDKEINQLESQVSKLQKKKLELEAEASKPSVTKEAVKDVCPIESKQMSIAQMIYSENRLKAQESHTVLEKLGPKVEIPMYNQPCDTAVYYENKRKFHLLRNRLIKCFKKRHRERELREKHLAEMYDKLMQEWLKKMEKKENNAAKKAKDAKLREFFEKQFPELKKQREDKERISRVSTRIRSESEWEEIIDGIQEQEMEEKKMRSYAVIPPIILESRQRKVWYVNTNGLIEDLSQEYKERQMINIWTDQEKEIFREKYLQHPKNFAIISSCLEKKSVADCVQYYYLSKKSENFKQLLRKHSVRKRTRALGKPQQNQQQIPQTTGVTTRQQEDAKASSLVSSCSTSVPSNFETTTQAPMDCSATVTSLTTTSTFTNCSASTTSCSVTTTVSTEVSNIESSGLNGSSNSKPDTGKILLPNNIRKKKEAALKMEGKEDARSDSDTASDQQNENNPAQPCAVCKEKLDNYHQSRALTKSNCSTFGIKESDLVNSMRVCASCRFKSVRKRCPIPTCKTPKRKVKRLRPLPGKLAELSKEAKDSLLNELEIPSDVSKCCSACFNRIVRKLENNSAGDTDTFENIKWTDYETDMIKQALNTNGTDWETVSSIVGTKSKEQCRQFFFTYKHKLGLDEIVHEFKKSKRYKESMQQDGKPPPIVTDEEESGETTSSCDEDDRADRCSSDTASAPSPVDKILTEVKSENQEMHENASESNQPGILNSDESRSRTLPHLDSSPKCQPDYDSSATVSADEGQNDGRDPSPRVVHGHSLKMSNDRKHFQSPMPIIKDEKPDTTVPLVKTLLQDPKVGTSPPGESSFSELTIYKSQKSNDKGTCVRDLIYQAIEMSLNSSTWPNKQERNNSPIPTSVPVVVKTESPDITIVEAKKEVDASGALIPPAHSSSRHPSRPNSHHMEVNSDFEVQDLSKKVKSRDVSPVKDFIKRERVVTPVRPPSASSNSGSHVQYYNGPPPPAHCNQYRTSQPPPPALSPHYVAEPHHETYYPRAGDPRGKSYLVPERPHSQPPHLVAQSSSLPNSSTVPPHAKPVPIKATVPPPPPLVASKPSQMSPKVPFKDRIVSLPPSGSITQGTPVNQQSIPVPPTNLSSSRYENFLRQLPPPQTKEGGSITLGTPVQHESVKRIPSNRPEGFPPNLPENIVRQGVPAMYDPSVMEYYRQVAPGGQQYAFTPGYPPYPSNMAPQRPPYANESQLSTKQIMIDFNTSKQMQMRRGGSGPPEKELKVSPRGADSSPASGVPQENHLHPMYPPANYQGGTNPHYNHVSSGYQPADSRYIHHRSQNAQLDRTRSPSGVESPINTNYPSHPGKRSPSLALTAGRQNVIHRSITWGTGKPSVIQAPQSASSRTPDMRTETISPANVRKSTPSPRHPQPLLYPSVPPSGHDAFNTLVNAAVAQPSLIVPKDGKGSPTSSSHSRQEVKSPRDRPVVEGLEKTLIDMHQRPRSYTESGHNLPSNERARSNVSSPSEQQVQLLNERYSSYDLSREQRMSEKQMLMNDQPSTLRLGNMREPFSREQFERQMRQTNVGVQRMFPKKEEERCRSGSSESHTPNYPSPSPQQSDLDNEASKIFSQSFQKDVPRSNSSPRGFTAANLIDAIITRQINQNPDTPAVTKNSGMDIFNQYHSGYEGSKTPPKPSTKVNSRTEVVTIDDEPENEKTSSWPERPNTQGRSPPVTSSNSVNSMPGAPMPYPSEKVYTLSEHIAAIISKDYNSPSDATQSQPLYSNSQSSASTSVTASRPSYVVGVASNSHNSNGKPLEGIASALPPEAVLVNSNSPHGMPDHSPQNCPGNGCSYHTHSWKLRRALQQDRDRDHRSPGLNETVHKRPSSNQSSDAPQEERQIIRVAQTSSPSASTSTRTSPTGPYGVEPISPPSQSNETMEGSNRNSSNSNSSSSLIHNQSPAWTSNPGITTLLATRHIYSQEYPEGIPPPSMPHYNVPTTVGSSSSSGPNRPPHQQQMGLSPLDYVKNRIVEVMRTADNEQEIPETRRPQSAMSFSEERDHQLQQHVYRFQPGSDREVATERPCSTGNGPPVLQGQRYSPAVTRYSPVPPRPSSAAERVPSRNSTPGEIPRSHKRGSEGHLVSGDWRDSPGVSSRASSRSVSPNSVDHPDSASRKKTRSEGTFIPESTTDRAPVLLPQNSIGIHRSGSLSEAPRLSSSNPNAQVLDGQSASKGIVSPRESYLPSQTESECYKYRVNDNRPESQWSLMNNHSRTPENEPLARLSEPMNIGAASSTTVEPFPPSNRTEIPLKTMERSEPGTRQSPVTGSGSQEPSRNSPSASSQGQRSATSTPIGMNVSSSSGLYSPFGAPNGSVSSSTNAMFSSATTLPPPASPHVAYSSFSGMGNTYAYPFSALSMRSLAVSTTHSSTSLTNSSSSVSSTHISNMPVNSSSRNSPSPLHRNNNQPPPLLSSQYEPLSDED